jgi:ferric-dicitrate binding protein FerR (iron transport regulator)
MRAKATERKMLKLINGDSISETEKTEIENWLKIRKKNRDYYEELKRIADKKIYVNHIRSIDLKDNWDRLQDKIQKNNIDNNSDHSFIQGLQLNISKIAAVLLILIVSSITVYLIITKHDFHIQQVNSVNDKSQVQLSDGSVIVLNKGSELDYSDHINRRKREVKLKGEAYFEINNIKNTPFFIYLQNTTVKVLGTSFNIKEMKNRNVEMHVITGKVSFYETGNKNNSIQLEAGQKSVFKSSSRKFEKTNYVSENFLYWKTGNLSFDDQPLELVLKELEKYFNVQFNIDYPGIENKRFTSECRGLELNEILHDISTLFDLQCIKQDDSVYILKANR